jgi:hypothetical protein
MRQGRSSIDDVPDAPRGREVGPLAELDRPALP